jgi:hypothetical protein
VGKCPPNSSRYQVVEQAWKITHRYFVSSFNDVSNLKTFFKEIKNCIVFLQKERLINPDHTKPLCFRILLDFCVRRKQSDNYKPTFPPQGNFLFYIIETSFMFPIKIFVEFHNQTKFDYFCCTHAVQLWGEYSFDPKMNIDIVKRKWKFIWETYDFQYLYMKPLIGGEEIGLNL